jgi:hypothetical protein
MSPQRLNRATPTAFARSAHLMAPAASNYDAAPPAAQESSDKDGYVLRIGKCRILFRASRENVHSTAYVIRGLTLACAFAQPRCKLWLEPDSYSVLHAPALPTEPGHMRVGQVPFAFRNEERFWLGGAAHEDWRWLAALRRAGERKTYWAKPPARCAIYGY